MEGRCPFRRPTPLGGDTRTIHPLLGTSADFGGPDAWLQLLKETTHVFEIMGVNRSSWRRTDGFSELLIEKARAGCTVRILLMHPDNPALSHYSDRSNKDLSYDDTVREIESLLLYYQAIANGNVNIDVRQVRTGCFHVQLTRTDRHVIAAQYAFSKRATFAPLWQSDKGTYLYDVMTGEFEARWAANGPAHNVRARSTPAGIPVADTARHRPRSRRKLDERGSAGTPDSEKAT